MLATKAAVFAAGGFQDVEDATPGEDGPGDPAWQRMRARHTQMLAAEAYRRRN